MYESAKFAGRYRHRKDRLAEIGFDPDMVAGSARRAVMPRSPLTFQDAHTASFVNDGVMRNIGRAIAIPGADFQTHGLSPVTLSGILGVSAVAGIKGCAKFFKNKEDREKFPNTTATFLRTNGVF